MSNLIDEIENFNLIEIFDKYDEGMFSEEPDAIKETHFIEKQIDQGPWTIISTYHTDSFPGLNIKWVIVKNGNKKVLKQTGINKEGVINWKFYIKKYILRRDIAPLLFFPAMVVGNVTSRNREINVVMVPLSKKNLCGILFNSINPMQHYICGLKKNKMFLLKRNFNSLSKLAVVRVKYIIGRKINLSVMISGDLIECFIDGAKKITVNDSTYKCGKCGLLANVPTVYESFSLKNDSDFSHVNRKSKSRKLKYPEAKLLKKIELPAKCSGRSIRFGDLSGEGQIDYLIVHGIHPLKDTKETISMTATDSKGKILWKKGDPAKENNIYPFDYPVQIYDIDNDGKNEVICEYNGKLQILNGKTGNVKHQIESPRLLTESIPKFSVLDSIYICNLSGKPRPEDFLIKDMYSNLYAYNSNLDMLWSYNCNTGHYPFTFDTDGTGQEKVLIGYTLLNSNGKKIWDLKLKDHADAVAIFNSNNERIVAIAASNEGFILADINGKIKKQLRIGHMQTVTVANLLPDSNKCQIATNTYWGNPGIIYILDFDGNVLNIFQPSIYGSPISPVKWTNEKSELILLSASKGSEGGLYNGYGQQAVSFPDDGHPNLCNFVYDIDNDGLDEILCWDHERLWIYRSEESGKTNVIRSRRFPQFYNQSNFRSNVSIP